MLDASRLGCTIKTVRTLQIIVGAMLMGVTIFMVIAITINLGKPPAFAITPIFLIASGMVFPLLIARYIAIRIFTAKAHREIKNGTYRRNNAHPIFKKGLDEDPEGESKHALYLLTLYYVRTMFSGALFEGLIFIALVSFLIEGNFFSLLLALILMFLLAAHFPTTARVACWLKKELESLEFQALK